MLKLLTLLSGLLELMRRPLKDSLTGSTGAGLLSPSQSWAIFISLLAIGVFLTSVLGIFLFSKHRSRDDLQRTRAAIERLDFRLQHDVSLGGLPGNLYDAIPGAIDASEALSRIQRICTATHVELLNIARPKGSEHHSQPGLDVYVFDLRLSGNYLDLKSFLAQLLVESPELWLARLQLQAEGSTVVASVSLHAWSADLKAAPQTRPLVTP